MNSDGQLLRQKRGTPAMLLRVSSSGLSQLSALFPFVAAFAGKNPARMICGPGSRGKCCRRTWDD